MIYYSTNTIKSIVTTLSETFLFRSIPKKYTESFINTYDTLEYETGAIIMNSEQYKNRLAVVLQGKISVKRHDTLLNTISKGGIFGAASLFGGESDFCFTSVEAKTKAKILFITQEQIEKLFADNGGAAMDYIAFLTDRIRFLNRKIDSFTSDSGTSKIAKFLLSFKKDSVVIEQSFTKLSETLDIGRATLYRAFDRLENDGAIRRDNRTVTILDAEKLKVYDD